MWKLNMKVWIVTIMLNTVSCKVPIYNPVPPTSDNNNNVKTDDPSSSSSCASCGSNVSLKIHLENNINGTVSHAETAEYAVKSKHQQSDDEKEGSIAVLPPSGRCQPQLELYIFGSHEDPAVIYEPPCTRINRCGGCCMSAFHKCNPTKTKITKFLVMKTTISGGNTTRGNTIIPVVEDLKCDCLCNTSTSNCPAGKKFDAKSCRCNCKNIGARLDCEDDYPKKRWDVDTCTCVCRNPVECNTGFTFNLDTCRCELLYEPSIDSSQFERSNSMLNNFGFAGDHTIKYAHRRYGDE